MRFATPMLSQVVAGRKMAVPVVVLFSRDSEMGGLPETDDIWIYASLVAEKSDTTLKGDLLKGRRSDSMHPLSRQGSGGSDDFAYASFTDLAVSTPGKYRLRVTAVDMKRSQQGQVVAAITSGPFEVIASGSGVEANGNVDAALRRLEELGYPS